MKLLPTINLECKPEGLYNLLSSLVLTVYQLRFQIWKIIQNIRLCKKETSERKKDKEEGRKEGGGREEGGRKRKKGRRKEGRTDIERLHEDFIHRN